MNVVGPREQSAERREIHDRTAATGAEQGRGGLRGEKLRFQIGGHDRVPIGFGELLERFAEKHADVVDEDVQAAAQFSGGVDKAQHFVAMRYVGFNGQRGAAKRLDLPTSDSASAREWR